MPISAEVPRGHPMREAWEIYRHSNEFENSKRWASFPEHVTGSLWAAFSEGWLRCEKQAAAPALLGALREIRREAESTNYTNSAAMAFALNAIKDRADAALRAAEGGG